MSPPKSVEQHHHPVPRRDRHRQDAVVINPSSSWSSAADEEDDGHHRRRVAAESSSSKMWYNPLALLLREAQAVILWSCTSMAFRLCLDLLLMLAAAEPPEDPSVLLLWGAGLVSPAIVREVAAVASVVLGWLVRALPSKVPSRRCPGFVFANPGILLWVNDKTGVLPNLPVRSCEYMMGRISLWEWSAVAVVHFITLYVTAFFVLRVSPDWIASRALAPVLGDGASVDGASVDGNGGGGVRESPWIVDLFLQVLLTAAFTVAVLVLPVLLHLNRLPRALSVVCLYPLFNWAVDGSSMGDSFSPNVLLSLSVLAEDGGPLPPPTRVLGSILGGLLGGRVMNVYFPDDERGGRAHHKY